MAGVASRRRDHGRVRTMSNKEVASLEIGTV